MLRHIATETRTRGLGDVRRRASVEAASRPATRRQLLGSVTGVILAGLLHLACGHLGPHRIGVLAALAGTSAFVYLGLVLDSPSRSAVVRHLLGAASTWVIATAALRSEIPLLPVAFFLHALFGALETDEDRHRSGLVLTWTIFHLTTAVLLTVGAR